MSDNKLGRQGRARRGETNQQSQNLGSDDIASLFDLPLPVIGRPHQAMLLKARSNNASTLAGMV
jgi:hypothetical protein